MEKNIYHPYKLYSQWRTWPRAQPPTGLFFSGSNQKHSEKASGEQEVSKIGSGQTEHVTDPPEQDGS